MIKIKLDNHNRVKDVELRKPLSEIEFLDSAVAYLVITARTILENRKLRENYSEEQENKDRALLHDLINEPISALLSEIYPEELREGLTPEELLAKLDEKAAFLKQKEAELKEKGVVLDEKEG